MLHSKIQNRAASKITRLVSEGFVPRINCQPPTGRYPLRAKTVPTDRIRNPASKVINDSFAEMYGKEVCPIGRCLVKMTCR